MTSDLLTTQAGAAPSRAGEMASLAYSPGYAAPEVVATAEAGEARIRVAPSADVWALGVIAFELLTETRVASVDGDRAAFNDALMGRAPLPWEESGPDAVARLRRLRRLRGSILQCLERDPAQRPSSRQVLESWNQMFDGFTTLASIGSTGSDVGLPVPPAASAAPAVPTAAAGAPQAGAAVADDRTVSNEA